MPTCIGVGTRGVGGAGGARAPPNILPSRIFILAAQIAVYYMTCMPRARGGCSMRQTSLLLGFVKCTSSIGSVGAESNAPVHSNAGEPTRPCTSGIDCFGAEDGTSVESSTGEPSRPSCAATFYKFGSPKMKLLPTPLTCKHRS